MGYLLSSLTFKLPKAVNLGRFSLLLRGGLRNQRFELSHPLTHPPNPPTHPPTHIITENFWLKMRYCI